MLDTRDKLGRKPDTLTVANNHAVWDVRLCILRRFGPRGKGANPI